MVSLKSIYDEYRAQNVRVSAAAGPLSAAAVEYGGRYGVSVNFSRFATMPQKKLALMHELGHCETGATHRLSSRFDLIEQHEYRADKAAFMRWIPPESFRQAFRQGLYAPWELAEHFDVPQNFVEKAWHYYINNGYL